jgi:hypothetical protein
MTISICLLKLEKEQRLEIRSAHIQITLGTPNNARMSILYVASKNNIGFKNDPRKSIIPFWFHIYKQISTF